jgi:hypothetical protein
VVIAANREFLAGVKFVPGYERGLAIFLCHPATNVWSLESEAALDERIAACMEETSRGSLSPAELEHLRTPCGLRELIAAAAGQLEDAHFGDLLDSNPDVFALDNMLVEAAAGVRRPVLAEDCVSQTAGWSYSERESRAHRGALERFLEQVLPEEEERDALLAFVATSLSGRRTSKKFLALADQRAGGSGATSLLTLLATFFGSFSIRKSPVRGVCGKHEIEFGRQAEGKRILLSDDTPPEQLDCAIVKLLTCPHDPNAPPAARDAWQANMVIAFIGYPQFTDVAVRARALVIPLRSKFVGELPENPEELEPHTHLADRDLSSRFKDWRSAMLDVMLERAGAV